MCNDSDVVFLSLLWEYCSLVADLQLIIALHLTLFPFAIETVPVPLIIHPTTPLVLKIAIPSHDHTHHFTGRHSRRTISPGVVLDSKNTFPNSDAAPILGWKIPPPFQVVACQDSQPTTMYYHSRSHPYADPKPVTLAIEFDKRAVQFHLLSLDPERTLGNRPLVPFRVVLYLFCFPAGLFLKLHPFSTKYSGNKY